MELDDTPTPVTQHQDQDQELGRVGTPTKVGFLRRLNSAP